MAAVPSAGRAARVERPAAPESDATRSLYERFAGQIFGYCLHQLGSREEAEDAVQTTFMNAFRGLQRGIVPQVESAWLFKIAHNVCLSRRRSTRRRGKVEAPNNFEVLQEVVPAHDGRGDELIRLQDALEGMPDTQRRAILLREWQGLSYREIAEELGISQSAVETLIFRARRALASGLEVEPARWRRRARHGFDAGTLVAALKGLTSVGTAAKVAATIAVATTAAVAVSGTGAHHASSRPHVTHVVHHSASSVRSAPVHVSTTLPPVRHVLPTPVKHEKFTAHPVQTAQARRATQPSVTPAPVTPARPESAPVSDRRDAPVVSTPAPEHAPAKVHDQPAQPETVTPAPAPPAADPQQQHDQQNVAGEKSSAHSSGNGDGHGHG